MRSLVFRMLAGTVLLAPLSPSLAAQSVRFTDWTPHCGIDFVHKDEPDTMGGGLCFLDYDQDGDQDLFVTSAGGGSNRLYRNDGHGRFQDVTKAAGLELKGRSMGAYAADLDDDGAPEILVLGNGAVHLYRNNGRGGFQDVTRSSGLDVNKHWAMAATFGDYDRDGRLDIYIGNYVGGELFPHFEGSPNLLFHNEGGLRFTERSKQAGVRGFETFWDVRGFPRGTYGCTLSVLFYDHDRDGWLDLLVGNDFGYWLVPDQLFRNNVDGTFTEVSAQAGFRLREFNMGIASADVNGDLVPDLYTTSLGPNHLLFNDGRGRLREVTAWWGDAAQARSGGKWKTSWACLFLDADLDGRRDLYVSNGHIRTVPQLANDPKAPSVLLRHAGDRLSTVPEPAFPWDRGVGRGAARADIDGDGDEDIAQLNNRDRLRIYRNETRSAGTHVVLDLVGTLSPREAIGAYVIARSAQRTQALDHLRGGSYLSGSAAPIVLGLGRDRVLEELSIRWPSGVTSRRFGLAGNRRHRIVEPAVTLVSVGRARAFGTSYLELPVTLHNHANRPHNVKLDGRLVWMGFRLPFPVHTAPLRIPGGSRATISAFVPIPPAALPLAKQLGVWLGIAARSGASGIDETEIPLR